MVSTRDIDAAIRALDPNSGYPTTGIDALTLIAKRIALDWQVCCYLYSIHPFIHRSHRVMQRLELTLRDYAHPLLSAARTTIHGSLILFEPTPPRHALRNDR